MIDKCVLITALARDCASNLPGNLDLIEKLRSKFKQSYVLIIENDSKDDTKYILNKYSESHNNVTIISKDYNGAYPFPSYLESEYSGMSCRRIARMAFFRNQILEYGLINFDFEYMVSLDIDVMSFSVDGIISALKAAPSNWGALFANGQLYSRIDGANYPFPFQYDYYAFLPKEIDIDKIDSFFYKFRLYQKYRAFKINRKVQKISYVEVLSGFGGLAIYKKEALEKNYYELKTPVSWNRKDVCLCEHISFHNRIADLNYSCYICRDIKVVYDVVERVGFKKLILKYVPILTALKS